MTKNKKRVLLLGAGGWAREHWIDNVLPDFKDKLEIVGLVDINQGVLKESAYTLGLPKNLLFTNIGQAINKVQADFCIVVLPPHAHKIAYFKAIEKRLPILSEKPITDNLKDTIEVFKRIKQMRIKMAITQNYRYESPIATLKKVIERGRLGKIDYIVARYASDYRKKGSWDVGSVYDMDYPLLVEGSIHHFDMIRYLSGANCRTIFCTCWNPPWSNFKDNANVMAMLEMTNGVKAIYEGSSLAAGFMNRWHQEYYRVECEKGSAVIDRGDRIVRVYTRGKSGKQIMEEIPLIPAHPSGHHKILTDFLEWLDGGSAPETQIKDNIQSALMTFAAIDSKKSNEQKFVQKYIEKSTI